MMMLTKIIRKISSLEIKEEEMAGQEEETAVTLTVTMQVRKRYKVAYVR